MSSYGSFCIIYSNNLITFGCYHFANPFAITSRIKRLGCVFEETSLRQNDETVGLEPPSLPFSINGGKFQRRLLWPLVIFVQNDEDTRSLHAAKLLVLGIAFDLDRVFVLVELFGLIDRDLNVDLIHDLHDLTRLEECATESSLSEATQR